MEVVSASHGALGPLLGKLTSLLADECARLKGVRREIRSLRSELISMQAVVQKYTKLHDPDVQLKAWMSLVRELAYDTEDVIDKFVHDLGDGSHHGGFKEVFRKIARQFKTLGSRRRIANQIVELKARVKEVKDLKSSYKLDDIACSSFEHPAVDPRLSALFVEKEHLVGIDGPRDDLVSWMVEEENCSTKHNKVLSIVGFGGLGKTTLAREVYHKIQVHFQCWAFVPISQKPNVKKIMKDANLEVIRSMEDTTELAQKKKELIENSDTWDEREFIAKLRELLQDKRYLIVIDDIWSVPAWDTIKCAFPGNNLSSRIITTTRIFDVARSCCQQGNGRIYEMEVLSDLHSKRLFFKRIFGSDECCSNALKEVSNKILKKCGGLPLAIISISSFLANRSAVKEEWERIARSIGSAMDKNRSLEGMNSILSLSYNDLPPNLKTCLLYLSIFPEDYVIDREDIVRRWIAERFITEERGQSKQEVAESYFYELINKSMVQPIDIGYDGKASACQVHDMMLELIISKSVEDNFISFMGHGQTDVTHGHGLIRRLSVHYIDQEVASVLENEDVSHIRSLTVIASTCIKHLPSLVEFEALRVLEFQGCQSMQEYDMNGIDKLFQLKYLSLRGTDISKVPAGVARLHGLETLDLTETFIEELPSEIVQLIKLRHLLIAPKILSWPANRTKIPAGIANMRNLQVVSGFNVIKSLLSAVEELGHLTALKELHLQLDGRGSQEYKRHEEMLLSSLCKLGGSNLQSLWILSDLSDDSTPLQFLDSWSPLPSSLRRFRMDTRYYLPKMPKWIVPELTSLAYLDINLIEITEEDLRILGEMPALLSLRLTFKSVQNDRLIVRGHLPLCLKEFCLYSPFSTRQTYLKFEEGALPTLEKLEVPFFVSVAKAYGFDFGIINLPCLKRAKIRLNNTDASSSESKAATAAIRKEASAHPNRPRVFILDRMEETESNEEES